MDLQLEHIKTRDELHWELAEKLQFPEYYGKNWDAFWDCIRDDEQSVLPSVLRISGWDALRSRLPREAESLRQLLQDMQAERNDCRVEWVSINT